VGNGNVYRTGKGYLSIAFLGIKLLWEMVMSLFSHPSSLYLMLFMISSLQRDLGERIHKLGSSS